MTETLSPKRVNLLPRRRLDVGRKWVVFFQDTNGLLFKGTAASLGVSATKGYQVNSLAVPRKTNEAIPSLLIKMGGQW